MMRLRNIYEQNLNKIFGAYSAKSPIAKVPALDSIDYSAKGIKPNLQGTLKFLGDCLDICFTALAPDGSFELSHPYMEIIHMIYEQFGIKEFVYKKNLRYPG